MKESKRSGNKVLNSAAQYRLFPTLRATITAFILKFLFSFIHYKVSGFDALDIISLTPTLYLALVNAANQADSVHNVLLFALQLMPQRGCDYISNQHTPMTSSI